MPRFFKRETADNEFKIEDTENNRWVGDGNGRQIKLNDEERIDNITDIMEKRVKGEWHE